MANFNRRKNNINNQSAFKRFRERRWGVEQSWSKNKDKLSKRRGIYLLPNALTTTALFCGFYAVVMAMNQKFDLASIAIFVAMLFDGLDGRVARLTHTQSEFGAQYDSLSDMVSFGVAPALVIYEWSLRGLGKWGWLAAFVYCAGAALRLARFNTNIAVVDKRYFQGLPSPAAAALIVGFIWIMDDLRFSGAQLLWYSWGITLFAGLSMVTNVPFYSFKDVNFRKSVPFIAPLLIVMAYVAVSSDPPKTLFAMFMVYGLSGYVIYFWRYFQGTKTSIVDVKEDHSDHF